MLEYLLQIFTQWPDGLLQGFISSFDDVVCNPRLQL